VKAVVIGPGRSGCGFAAPALRASGHELVLVGRDAAVVENLDRLGRYWLRLTQDGERRAVTVDRVRALRSDDVDRVAAEIAGADVLATAVGAHQLEAIAPLIAAGLGRRITPLNVLCFENLADVGSRLRAHVGEHLSSADGLGAHGFAGALVMRAVTRRLGDPHDHRPLTFVGDPAEVFMVERQGLVAPLPRLPGMVLVADYTAAVHAKLYIFSAGHATAAYLGHLRGHAYIHARDPVIRTAVIGAMAEGREGIAARYGQGYAGGPGCLRAIAARFRNAALRDPVSRVGRDPLRKLAPDDRLIGAARLALASGIEPVNLCTAAAAALRFDTAGDASVDLMRTQIERDGVERTLCSVTGLQESDPLVTRIVAAWDRLGPQGADPGGSARRLDPSARE
jgi:mannitol-1-phosphate 5-dehydrogenase